MTMPPPVNFRRATFSLTIASGILALGLGGTSRTPAQSPASPATDAPLAFEVSSIKVNHSADNRMGVRFSPGRLTATGIGLKFLIANAYNVRPFQISGGPNWINTEKYDIDAKMPDGLDAELEKLPMDQRREKMSQLMQSLLADRFQLKVSHQTKEGPVYNLVVAKNGPLIHEAKPPVDTPDAPKGPDGKPIPRNFMRMMPGDLSGQAVPIEFLAQQLSMQTGRKVIDQTGLKGSYDFELKWSPEPGPGGMMGGGPAGGGPPGGGPPGAGPGPGPDGGAPPDASGPSIFTALQEQLGLKLDSAKGPVDMLVIDHVEKPTEN